MSIRQKESKIILGKINLTDCPEGIVFNLNDPDKSIEEKYFPGWKDTLERNGRAWEICKEKGGNVLAHAGFFTPVHENCLIVDDPLWQDYSISVLIRQLTLVPSFGFVLEDGTHLTSRNGIAFRYQNS